MLRLASRRSSPIRACAAALDNPKLDAPRDKESLLLSIAGDEPRRATAAISSACWSRPTASRVLPQIRTLFEALKNEADGVAKATIDTAFPLDRRRSSAELKAALEKRFGKKIETTVDVDPR